jgi:Protein of unknown function (DUF2778)
VRGAKLHAAKTLGRDRGILVGPRSRLICAGIGALAIGYALGLQAMPPAVPVSETIQPKNPDPWASLEPQTPSSGGWRLASLDTEALFASAATDPDGQSESVMSTRRSPSSAREILQSTLPVASFDERFAGAVDWPGGRRTAVPQESAGNLLPPWFDPGGPAAARRAVGQSARGVTPLPALPPAGASKKQVRIAEASEDSTSPPEADEHTAIYDISAHRVYLPNGQTLEAHSGLGNRLDDPRYVSEKDRGPTPPNVYELSLREESFHGVRAIRLSPVGDGNMFGRDGMLAHSYMLGPNGQSNGCVSINDYPAFLNAYLGGDINRLVVVEHLTRAPGSRTALGGLVGTIKAFFGRS